MKLLTAEALTCPLRVYNNTYSRFPRSWFGTLILKIIWTMRINEHCYELRSFETRFFETFKVLGVRSRDWVLTVCVVANNVQGFLDDMVSPNIALSVWKYHVSHTQIHRTCIKDTLNPCGRTAVRDETDSRGGTYDK